MTAATMSGSEGVFWRPCAAAAPPLRVDRGQRSHNRLAVTIVAVICALALMLGASPHASTISSLSSESGVAAQTDPAGDFVATEASVSPVFVGANAVYVYDGVLGCCVAPSSRLGGLVDVAVDDPAAQALAQRLGGRPSVRFAGDASGREFDVVSDLYIAQSKPANFQLGSSFRNQAKATFEAALETNRTPYFHFEGAPQAGVIAKLEEYGARYGIDPIIDVSPLG